MNKFFLFLLLVSLPCFITAQKRFRVMEYNVENLFDTLHAEGREDMEFLPEAERRWTSVRYWGKIERIKRVIAAVGEDVPPDLIALCEVENDSVLHHLFHRTALRRWNYRYLISRSPDRRGINVALVYRSNTFRPHAVSALRIPYDADRERPTRDILCVSGTLPCGDTLDVCVCHFPSRSGGQQHTESYRCRTAARLKQHADSIMSVREKPALLLLGDFNDEPSDKSLRHVLRALPPSEGQNLCLLSADKEAPQGIRGTYKYRGFWNRLDHIIVNRRLLSPESTLRTLPDDCRIVDFPFLLEPDNTHGGVKPKSYFRGTYYRGGYSDHLPLVLDLWY